MNTDNLSGKTGDCKRGFFVVRKCEKPAIARCALSQRLICEDCAQEHNGELVCREVYYQKLKEEETDFSNYQRSTPGYERNDYGIWYYHLRHRFYENEDYEPFTEYDDQAFDENGGFLGDNENPYWDDEQGKSSFYDS